MPLLERVRFLWIGRNLSPRTRRQGGADAEASRWVFEGQPTGQPPHLTDNASPTRPRTPTGVESRVGRLPVRPVFRAREAHEQGRPASGSSWGPTSAPCAPPQLSSPIGESAASAVLACKCRTRSIGWRDLLLDGPGRRMVAVKLNRKSTRPELPATTPSLVAPVSSAGSATRRNCAPCGVTTQQEFRNSCCGCVRRELGSSGTT